MQGPDTIMSIPEVFRYCPACGGERAADKAEENPLQCEHCELTYYFNPTVAVATLVSNPQGHLIFIRRQRDPGMGKLGLPGGFIDLGETAEEAARREAEEELSLSLPEISFLASYPNRYVYRSLVYEVLDLFFVSEVKGFDQVQSDESEVRDWIVRDPAEFKEADFAFESNWRAVETWIKRPK